MIASKRRMKVENGEIETRVLIWCPGCDEAHALRVDGKQHPVWTWNGSLEKPTFSPSLLVNAADPNTCCHSFIVDGKIRFLNDCGHHLRGQTVDLGELPDWMRD